VLYWHLDEGLSAKELIAKGFSEEVINQVLSTIKKTEYKRRQCPPGIKVHQE